MTSQAVQKWQELEVNPPRRATRGTPRYRGPGVGEIKPHTVGGIRDGLTQLMFHTGAATRLLVTYRFVPPHSFRVFVLEPRPEILTWREAPRLVGGRRFGGIANIPNRLPGRDDDWADSLGTWWELPVPAFAPTLSMADWLARVGPTVFGSMAEPVVRSAFFQEFKPKKRLNESKLPNVAGADLSWQELAEYFQELASELAAAG
jgi:hypothetical protein